MKASKYPVFSDEWQAEWDVCDGCNLVAQRQDMIFLAESSTRSIYEGICQDCFAKRYGGHLEVTIDMEFNTTDITDARVPEEPKPRQPVPDIFLREFAEIDLNPDSPRG